MEMRGETGAAMVQDKGMDEDEGLPVSGIVSGAAATLHELEPGDLFVALPFVDGDAHTHVMEALGRGAALALVSEAWPGLEASPREVRRRCIVVKDVVGAFRAFATAFRRRLPYPVAAVAGANGKTTTKEMLAALLSGPGRRVVKTPGTDNGFLGLPRTLCCRAHSAAAPPDAVVLEVGIDEPGAMEQHARMIAPDVAVITALGAEHLGGMGSVSTAVEEELRLFEATPGARRVVPWGDPEIRRRAWLLRAGDAAVVDAVALSAHEVEPPPAGSVLLFRAALSGASSAVELSWCPDGDTSKVAWSGRLAVPMPGAHNARNAAMAVAAALLLGRPGEELGAGWETFEPPPWRSRVMELERGALLYDDCFNASPLSVEAALAALRCEAWAGRPKVAVLGDMLDLGAEALQWHLALTGPLLSVRGLRLFLFGSAMSALGAHLCASGSGGMVAGSLAEDRDPVDLVAGLDLPAGTVVLVKGSRGMRLDRVARYLELRWRAGADRVLSRWAAPVCVVGSYGTLEATRAIARALQCFGPGAGRIDRTGAFIDGSPVAAPPGLPGLPEVLRRCIAAGGRYAVVEALHGEVLAAAAGGPFAVGVFTGLSGADLLEGGDAEVHLAQKAQLFARQRGLRAAVLDGDDPASALIAEVLPPGVRVLRYGTAGAALGPVDLLASSIDLTGRGARLTLSGGPEMPTSIDVSEGGQESVRGALAALLVMTALGGDPRQAAVHLC